MIEHSSNNFTLIMKIGLDNFFIRLHHGASFPNLKSSLRGRAQLEHHYVHLPTSTNVGEGSMTHWLAWENLCHGYTIQTIP